MNPVLTTLTERRTCRCGVAYFPWLFIYLLTAAMLIHGKGGRDADELLLFWPVLIPAGIVNFQLVRPTVLGWLVILVIAVLLGCLQTFLAYLTFSQHDIPPEDRIKDIILLSAVVFAWVSVPIGLIVVARPTILPKSPAA